MVALTCEALQPNPVCHQQMVQRSAQAFEERPDITPIVGAPQRQGGIVQPRVGPKIVGCELLKVLLHGSPLRNEWLRSHYSILPRSDDPNDRFNSRGYASASSPPRAA